VTDLTWALPQPVALPLGGAPYLCLPLRLRHLARLQELVKSRHPCPLDALRPGIAAAEPGSLEYRRLVAAALDACEAWPPPLSAPESDATLEAPVGTALLIGCCLETTHPGLAAPDLWRLAGVTTPEELAALRRLAFQVDPLGELARLVDPETYARRGKPADWGKAIVALIRAYPGYTLASAGELTLRQFELLRTDGEPARGDVAGPGVDLAGAARRRRAFFDGLEASAN
jgi:hypothetical protein